MIASHHREGSAWAVAGLFALLLALGSCTGQEPAEPTGNQEANLTAISISIDGMSCSACVARVKKKLTSMDGVADVEVNLGARAARVRYAPDKVSPDRLVAAINDLGYRAGAPTEAE